MSHASHCLKCCAYITSLNSVNFFRFFFASLDVYFFSDLFESLSIYFLLVLHFAIKYLLSKYCYFDKVLKAGTLLRISSTTLASCLVIEISKWLCRIQSVPLFFCWQKANKFPVSVIWASASPTVPPYLFFNCGYRCICNECLVFVIKRSQIQGNLESKIEI